MSTDTKRFYYSPPWEISDWGLSFFPIHYLFNKMNGEKTGPLKLISRSGDQWGNEAIDIIVPLLGGITIFYGKNIDVSTWFFSGMVGGQAMYISPDMSQEAQLPVSRIAKHYNLDLTTYDDLFDGLMDHVLTIQPDAMKILLKREGKLENIN